MYREMRRHDQQLHELLARRHSLAIQQVESIERLLASDQVGRAKELAQTVVNECFTNPSGQQPALLSYLAENMPANEADERNTSMLCIESLCQVLGLQADQDRRYSKDSHNRFFVVRARLETAMKEFFECSEWRHC